MHPSYKLLNLNVSQKKKNCSDKKVICCLIEHCLSTLFLHKDKVLLLWKTFETIKGKKRTMQVKDQIVSNSRSFRCLIIKPPFLKPLVYEVPHERRESRRGRGHRRVPKQSLGILALLRYVSFRNREQDDAEERHCVNS